MSTDTKTWKQRALDAERTLSAIRTKAFMDAALASVRDTHVPLKARTGRMLHAMADLVEAPVSSQVLLDALEEFNKVMASPVPATATPEAPVETEAPPSSETGPVDQVQTNLIESAQRFAAESCAQVEVTAEMVRREINDNVCRCDMPWHSTACPEYSAEAEREFRLLSRRHHRRAAAIATACCVVLLGLLIYLVNGSTWRW